MGERVYLFKTKPRGQISISDRALEVFELVKQDKSRKEIAEKLGVSVRRVQELLDQARAYHRDQKYIAAAAGGR